MLLMIAVGPLGGAPAEHNLGEGLAYFRVHELPRDLPANPTGPATPCVVDLRYVRAEADAATAFLAWLKFRATPRLPVLVLANAETSPALLRPLARHERMSGIVVVGLPGRNFAPDIEVKTTAELERRAYEALESGVLLNRLLTDNPEKARNDEASLSKDRLAEAAADAADTLISGPTESPPIDATLQRAVHLHRALVALKKI